MGVVPGPRTSPTVKSSAQTSQRSLRSWHLSLSAFQVALLLGGVLGSLACAFYLGFFSGQKVGLEMALSNNLSAAMRLPIGEEEDFGDDSDLDTMTDVYAKLRQVELPANDSDELNDLMAESARAKEGSGFTSPQDNIAGRVNTLGEISAKASLQLDDDDDLINAVKDVNKAEVGRRGVDSIASDSIASGAIASGNMAKGLPASGISGRVADVEDSSAPAKVARAEIVPGSGGLVSEQKSRTEVGARTLGELSATESKSNRAGSMIVRDQKLDPARNVARIGSSPEGSRETAKSVRPEAVAPDPSGTSRVITSPAKANVQGSLVRDRLPRGWFAQVGAPDNRGEAEQLGRALQNSGFPVVIENAKVRGQEYFRILVGPEQTRQQAERLMGQLKREPTVKADPFIRMVR